MTANLSHFVRYQLPAFLWAVFIFGISSVPASKIPKFAHLFNDKFIHASIFFVFGLLVYRALAPRISPESFDWRRLVIATSAVILYGISDELHQWFVPGRSMDVLDAAADSLGGFLSAAAVYARHAWKKPADDRNSA